MAVTYKAFFPLNVSYSQFYSAFPVSQSLLEPVFLQVELLQPHSQTDHLNWTPALNGTWSLTGEGSASPLALPIPLCFQCRLAVTPVPDSAAAWSLETPTVPTWRIPAATAADNSIWKIVFHLPANRKRAMTVAQAMTNGYGINTTPTQILVRAAYNSTESQPQVIQTVPMAVLRSTTFYKQRWMVMMVDTAVACPTDGTAFTEQMITWNVPRVLPPLVPTPQITTLDVQMGVDGRKLDPATIHNRDYKLDVGPQLITVKIPVGADGGYYKSHVLDNTYVISYSIEPMLEHTWQDGPEKTKYTVLHPITTPFMPRPPVVTNNTVPKARVFNVTLGTFLPDVELVKILVGPETLTVPEANLKGYNVQEHVFPNGSKTCTLQVPFEDPNVKQKVTPPDTRTYILPLTYLLNIVPENTSFTHPAVVKAILQDIIPPTVTGFCDGAAFYTMVISSSGIRSRLDLTLKDIETMVVVANFSLSCSFPTKMIDCFTNGTMAALAVKVESVPSLLRVACHYLVNDTKVVQFLYQNNPAPVVQPGLGDLAVIMRLALELLYSRGPQTELFLENCWATYSADRNSSPKWDVVVDSCEKSADEYLTIFHPVSSNARVRFPSHLKRFEVKMFSFTSGLDALKGQWDSSGFSTCNAFWYILHLLGTAHSRLHFPECIGCELKSQNYPKGVLVYMMKSYGLPYLGESQGTKMESVYIKQEEVLELVPICIKQEMPELEPVHIKEENELEPVHIKEETEREPVHIKEETEREPVHIKEETEREPVHIKEETEREPVHIKEETEREPVHIKEETEREPVHIKEETEREPVHIKEETEREPVHIKEETEREPVHIKEETEREPVHIKEETEREPVHIKEETEREPVHIKEETEREPVHIKEETEREPVHIKEETEREPVHIKEETEREPVHIKEETEREPVHIKEETEREPVHIKEETEREPVHIKEETEREPVHIKEETEREPVHIKEETEREPVHIKSLYKMWQYI
ncbi:UNVERIFIED_CONTAM: hypothetical protein FKN15_006128 [Acipenser sinensis]